MFKPQHTSDFTTPIRFFYSTKSSELTDHLGNVRATFQQVGAVPSGTVQVTSWQDYYAFGSVMPGRRYVDEDYAYGYQGQEDCAGPSKWKNFELRQLNTDLGRWMAPDPYGQFHSPYIAMGNMPTMGTDPDGGYWNTHAGASTWVGDSWHRQLQDKLYYESTWLDRYNKERKDLLTWNWQTGRVTSNDDPRMQALYAKYGMDSYGNMLGVQTEEFKVDYSWLMDRPRTGVDDFGTFGNQGVYSEGALNTYNASVDGMYVGSYNSLADALQASGARANEIYQQQMVGIMGNAQIRAEQEINNANSLAASIAALSVTLLPAAEVPPAYLAAFAVGAIYLTANFVADQFTGTNGRVGNPAFPGPWSAHTEQPANLPTPSGFDPEQTPNGNWNGVIKTILGGKLLYEIYDGYQERIQTQSPLQFFVAPQDNTRTIPKIYPSPHK